MKIHITDLYPDRDPVIPASTLLRDINAMVRDMVAALNAAGYEISAEDLRIYFMACRREAKRREAASSKGGHRE